MKTKKKILFAVFFIGVILVLGSCTGDDGPMGPEGPIGPQGEIGPAGPAGADGSVLYSGTDDPLSSTGQDGDYYLNTTSGELFGPKTAGEWTDSFMLKGEEGEAGSKILSGIESPDQATGVDGDFYLDTDDILLYGPKISGAWGAGLELKGADGNANVKTYALNILFTDWEREAYTGSTIFTRKIEFPALTSDIHNNGAVLIYQKETNSETLSEDTLYTILPITEIMTTGAVRTLKCDVIKNVTTALAPPPILPTITTTFYLEFSWQFAWSVSVIMTDKNFKIVLIQGEYVELAKQLEDKGLTKMASEIGFTL